MIFYFRLVVIVDTDVIIVLPTQHNSLILRQVWEEKLWSQIPISLYLYPRHRKFKCRDNNNNNQQLLPPTPTPTRTPILRW